MNAITMEMPLPSQVLPGRSDWVFGWIQADNRRLLNQGR